MVGGGEGRYSCWRSRRGTPHPLHMLSTAELPRVHRVIVRAPRVRDAPSLSPGHTGVRRKVAASRQECEQNAELVDLRSTLFENTWPDPYTHKEPRSPSSWDAATPAPRLGATAHVRNNRRRRKTGWGHKTPRLACCVCERKKTSRAGTPRRLAVRQAKGPRPAPGWVKHLSAIRWWSSASPTAADTRRRAGGGKTRSHKLAIAAVAPPSPPAQASTPPSCGSDRPGSAHRRFAMLR